MGSLLEVRGLTKSFGGLRAVDAFDMTVNEGEIVGLIGPNGAGKSTIFNLITGVHGPDEGVVRFGDRDITGVRPHRVAELGIGRTFQLNPLFGEFTVLENVVVSSYLHPRSGWVRSFLGTSTYRRNEALVVERAKEVLEAVGLGEQQDVLAAGLPHGFQKMLGMARALAARPRLMLLDEPLQGMNQEEISHSMEAIRNSRDTGITFVIVEHNMQILDLCDRVVVISFGEKICEGLPNEIRDNKEVIAAYLGRRNVA